MVLQAPLHTVSEGMDGEKPQLHCFQQSVGMVRSPGSWIFHETAIVEDLSPNQTAQRTHQHSRDHFLDEGNSLHQCQ